MRGFVVGGVSLSSTPSLQGREELRGPATTPNAVVRRISVPFALSDIRVYTYGMKIVKVRRVGNSNVVSIPRELEARGYVPGTSVLVEELEGGELRIVPTDQVRQRVRDIGRRVVSERGEALKILAEHDPGDDAHAR